MIKFSLMWLLGCASQLQIEDSNKEGFAPPYPPEPPPTLGVNIEEGCDQAAIGSKVCNLVLLDQHDDEPLSAEGNKVIYLSRYP